MGGRKPREYAIWPRKYFFSILLNLPANVHYIEYVSNVCMYKGQFKVKQSPTLVLCTGSSNPFICVANTDSNGPALIFP